MGDHVPAFPMREVRPAEVSEADDDATET